MLKRLEKMLECIKPKLKLACEAILRLLTYEGNLRRLSLGNREARRMGSFSSFRSVTRLMASAYSEVTPNVG